MQNITGSRNQNYIPWNRNWAVVRRHAPLILKPFFTAVLITCIWLLLKEYSTIGFGKETENPLLFIVLPFLSFIYAIFAGYAVNAVFGDFKDISKAVVQCDMDTFLTYRDEQLPILIHLLVGTTSLLILLTTILFPFEQLELGAFSVFTVTFMMVLVYVIVRELDDYQHSIWFKERIPEEWYEVDIIKHFEEKAKEKANLLKK